jgi:hypothetical protein
MPDPIPRWLRWCAWSFLPIEQRPSPCGNRVGAPRYPFNRFRREPNFGAAGFVSVLLASTFACRTDGSDLRDARGRRGVYIPAEHGLLPHHAWDMLITRIDQLVMGRLALPQLLSLVGCSSRIRLSGCEGEYPQPCPATIGLARHGQPQKLRQPGFLSQSQRGLSQKELVH